MVFCSKCGKKLNERARFCPRCAHRSESGEARALPFRSQEAAVPFSWDQAGQMRDLSREFQESDVEQNKLMAVLSYFSLLVLLPILCAKDSKYARFHANQGLMLLLVSMGWQFISAMLNLVFDRYWWQFRFLLSLSGVGYLLILVLFCMGVANAVTGKAKELPLIGHFRILH